MIGCLGPHEGSTLLLDHGFFTGILPSPRPILSSIVFLLFHLSLVEHLSCCCSAPVMFNKLSHLSKKKGRGCLYIGLQS